MTIWQPRVVESVSAICSGDAPTTSAKPARTCVAQPRELLDVRHPAAALLEIAREPRLRRLDRRARQRPVRAGVEVRLALEHGELGASGLVIHGA